MPLAGVFIALVAILFIAFFINLHSGIVDQSRHLL